MFPAEDAGFVSGSFGFGDQAFALVRAGNRGPGEDVLRVEFEQSLARFDGAVKILLGVIGLRQAMERVGKLGIEIERFFVFRHGFRIFSFAEKIGTRVIVFFGARVRRARHPSILTSDNRKSGCAYATAGEGWCAWVTAC